MDFFEQINAAITSVQPPEPEQVQQPTQQAPQEQAPTPGTNVFTDLPQRVNTEAGQVLAAGDTALTVLNAVGTGLQQAARDREAAVAQANQARDGIIAGIDEQTNSVKERIAPLFAKRAAIDERQRQLAEMNPLKRGILGLVNRNYNEGYLNQQERLLEDEIQGIGQEFSDIGQIQMRLLGVVDQREKMTTAEIEAKSNVLNTDFNVALESFKLAQNRLQATLGTASAQTEIARAKMMLIEEQLGTLGMGNINSAIASAQKNGGVAIIGGAEIPLARLQDRFNQLQRQDIALRTDKAQLQGTQMRNQMMAMQLNEAQKGLLLENMSLPEVKMAMNNGGMFRGVKLDPVALAKRAEGLVGSLQVQAAVNSGESVTNFVVRQTRDLATVQTGLIQRAKELGGGRLPNSVVGYLRAEEARTVQLKEQLAKAGNNAELRQTIIQNFGATLQNSYDQISKLTDQLAAGLSNDPDARAVLKAHLTGNPVTPEQASRGIAALVSGGNMPPGLRLSGVTGTAMTQASKALTVLKQSQKYKDANADEKKSMEVETVSKTVGAQWNSAHASTVFDSVPSEAQRQGHPFARLISPEQYAQAKLLGDQKALDRMAAELNIKPRDLEILMKDPRQAEQFNSTRTPDQKVNFESIRNNVLAAQQVGFIQQLDSISPGAGKAFVNFIQSPGFQSRIGEYADAVGNAGFADSLAAAAGGNNLRNRLSQFMNSTAQAYTAAQRATAAEKAAVYQTYGNSPVLRTESILAMNPALTPQDRKELIRVLKDSLPPAGSRALNSADAANEEAGTAETDFLLMTRMIKGQKFQDPNLERIRKIAAKDFDQDTMRAAAMAAILKGN